MTEFNRREMLGLTAGAVAAVAFVPVTTTIVEAATADAVNEAIAKFTGGSTPGTGLISLRTPEIAENGNTVPVEVSVESPMTDESYVESVLILADGNPNPGVATFHFSPVSGEANASTRIRLAKTQDIIAVAKMNDGTAVMEKRTVKVTIGGCGG